MDNLIDHVEPAPAPQINPKGPSRLRRLIARIRRSKVIRLVLGLAVLAAVIAVMAFGVLRVLKPSQRFTTFTLPYVQDFIDVDPKLWFVSDGIWSIRQEMLAQLANLSKPTSIYVPQTIAGEQPYHLSTYITLAKSTQHAGVNFNAQYPNMTSKQHQVYIARRLDDVSQSSGTIQPSAKELVAGYTGEDGAFIKQVAVPFDLDSDTYRLDIYVLGNTYTVQLNGQTLIDRRPLFFTNGLVGYYSLGPAKFDGLQITTAETKDPGEQVYVSDFDQQIAGAGWVPFSGEWEIADGELIQADPAVQDAAIGYEGSAFEDYVVQANFHHLVGAGGGLLFNMFSPYQLNDAHVVRFSDQSDSVFWGYFDEKGLFTRQGFSSADSPGTDQHQLRVYVGNGTYDVYLEDRLLARNVPLHLHAGDAETGRTSGHIGLITSRSSVAYRLVEVFPLLGSSRLPLEIPRAATPNPLAASDTLTGTEDATDSVTTPVGLPTAKPRATSTEAHAEAIPKSPTATVTASSRAESAPMTDTVPTTGTPTPKPTVTPKPAAIETEKATTPPSGVPATNTPHIIGTSTAVASTAAQAAAVQVPVTVTAAVAVMPTDAKPAVTAAPATLTPTRVPTATTPAATGTISITTARATITPLPDTSPILQKGAPGLWQSDFRGDMLGKGWRPISGQWRFNNDSLAQEDATGVNQAIVYTHNAFQDYSFTTSFAHRDGNGAGVLFNMPYKDRLNGATMVRYSDRRPGGIFWGYFDDSGKFVGQGYTNVSPPGDALHTLRVVSEDATYSIYLDDFLLAADIPQHQNYGYAGLVTVQSSVGFDSARVDAIPSTATTGQAPAATQALAPAGTYSGTAGFPDQQVVSGKWTFDPDAIRQTVPDSADYVLNTGIYASNYSIRTDISLSNKPDVGGGFMVQMPERGRKAGATVVRIINGGKGIFWGVYDESGTFRGRGSVDLPSQGEGETGYQMQVKVRGNTMDVYVDNALVIKGAAIPRAEGWIGLIAYGGPVTFSNTEITVEPTP